jgi:hypothetical protein
MVHSEELFFGKCTSESLKEKVNLLDRRRKVMAEGRKGKRGVNRTPRTGCSF